MVVKDNRERKVSADDIKTIKVSYKDFLDEINNHPEWDSQDIATWLILIYHLYDKKGKLKYEPARLAAWCRLSQDEFKESWEKIKHKYRVSSKGIITQKKVSKVLKEAVQSLQDYVDYGRQGAHKRWGIRDGNGQANRGGIGKPEAINKDSDSDIDNSNNICIVDKRKGFKYQFTKDKKKKVWLCARCHEAFKLSGRKMWGWMKPINIETVVLKNRRKVPHEKLGDILSG